MLLSQASAIYAGSSPVSKIYGGATQIWPAAPLGARPSFRSASYGRIASGTALAVTVPAGVADGDLLVAFVGLRPTRSISAAPAGWTERFVSVGSGSAPGIACYTKTAAGEPGSYTWTTSASDQGTVSIAAYSGAVVGAVGTAASAFSNNPTISGVTSPSGNSVWVAAVMAAWQTFTVSDGAAGGWTTRQTSTATTHLWQRISDKPVGSGAQAADNTSFDLLNGTTVSSDYWITGSVVLVPT